MRRFNHIYRTITLFFTAAASFLLFSCSGVMGHSVLLWDIPDKNLQDGDIVPVYIKSNISHVYVISVPGTGERMEIPLWQISEPQSRHKAKKLAKKYSEYVHTYAHVKLDGLPVRADTVNTAKQVYRLRKGETVKVLYKGKGQTVMAGKKPLEGTWLHILTQDGTQGWCFSYNLDLFKTERGGAAEGGESSSQTEEKDSVIESVLAKTWYPDYFRTMIESKRIDPARMNASYSFSVDRENNKVNLNLPEIHQSWTYSGSTKLSDTEYTLNDIPVKITVKNDTFIVVTYTDENGKPQDLNFITLGDTTDIAALVAEEKDRRLRIYEQVYMFGPEFSSSNYGQLSLKNDQTFAWKGYKLLVPSVINASAKNGGTVSVKFFLGDDLAQSYDGVLTFRFDGTNKDVNFLYKMESGGLRLEDASGASYDGSTVNGRGMSPLVLFFQKN